MAVHSATENNVRVAPFVEKEMLLERPKDDHEAPAGKSRVLSSQWSTQQWVPVQQAASSFNRF